MERFETWPDARALRQSALEVLKARVEAADSLTQEVLPFLEKTENMHHRGSIDAAPYIQDTTQQTLYVCTSDAGQKEKSAEQNNVDASAHHKNEIRSRMGARIEPTAHDIDCAVRAILPELGINISAWADACRIMGRDVAAMCVIITDANRDHPKIRVRNPGGYLRGMTSAFRAGNLNIMGSLIALSERRASEERSYCVK